MQQVNSSTAIPIKQKKPIINLILLAVFVAAGLVCTGLHCNGVGLYQISESFTLMFYLAFVCYCIAGYNLCTLITAFFIKAKQGTPGETT
ncbi:MAG: hypothetical protein FWD16_07370, partial [Clostridia bacterium]|nr:hypothetical protein [Clostridia bacterium]